jgi:PmbA protein
MDEIRLAKEIVSKASVTGAEVEVFIQVGKETQIQVDQGKVEKLSHAGNKGLGVRIILEGSEGYAYTSDFSPGSVEKTWKSAYELAKVGDQDPHRSLPDPGEISDEDLKIFDERVGETPISQKIAFALEVERAALGFDKRIVLTNRCSYLDQDKTVYLVNSKGFLGSYKQTIAVSYLNAIAKEAETTSMALGLGASTFMSDLNAEAIGVEAGRNAIRMLGGKPVPSQEASAVFSPLVASQLITFLSLALKADEMQRARSFLLDRIGEDVASDIVSLLDNGRLKRGLASVPFDTEGVPSRATKVIEEGVLQGVLHNSYTARKEGVSSTGNASRSSHRHPPALYPTNFYLQPGEMTPEAIISGVERGLYVLNTMTTGGINPVTGDYSVAARGIWIENGELMGPVNEVTLAAPMNQMLKHVSAVGNDLRFVPMHGVFGSPTIRIDGMTIAGK